MTYQLFLDDDAGKGLEPFRDPPKDQIGWKVAHSTAEAQAIVKEFGVPRFLALDHDLGVLEDGSYDKAMTFIKWLADEYPDAIDIIEGYDVHSLNTEGRLDIIAYMDSWRKSRTME